MPWIRATAIAVVMVVVAQRAGLLGTSSPSAQQARPVQRLPRAESPNHNNVPPRHVEDQSNHPIKAVESDAGHEEESSALKSPTSMAIAIVLTEEAKTEEKRHLLADGAAVLAESVRSMKSKFHIDLVAIVHPTVKFSRPILEKLGYRVLEKPDPLVLDPNKGTKFFRETVMKAGCCGLREMLKLHAFRLHQYKKVLLLDIDTMIVQNIDELFERDKMLLYVEDLPMDPHHHNAAPPMQGGFFMIQTGPKADKAYDDIVAIMVDGNFNAGSGWNNSKIGYHWGGAAVQGVYAYYFARHAPKDWSEPIDRCIYNYMGPDDPKLMKPEELNKCSVDEIKTAHFTICQKPWSCHIKNEGACPALHRKWWDLRWRVEANMFPDREINRKPCTNQPFPYHPIGITA